MSAKSRAFGIFKTAAHAEKAVDQLFAAQFTGTSISVLHPKNQTSREFAQRKNTKLPEGTEHGETANLPLGGTLGFMDPGAGPKGGALPQALADMGVPAEWCNGRVLAGKILVSVECESAEQVESASDVLRNNGAEEIDSITPPSESQVREHRAASLSGTQDPWPEIGSRNRPSQK